MDPSLGEIESEEACIQEVIAQFYLFIQKMVQLRNDVELEPGLDHRARDRILDQLEGIEGRPSPSPSLPPSLPPSLGPSLPFLSSLLHSLSSPLPPSPVPSSQQCTMITVCMSGT